jgi:predicted nucleic acid-binding protein
MTKTSVILDANILVAVSDERDKWHVTAVALRNALVNQDAQLVFFDCVVNEAIAVIGRRTEEQNRSDQFGRYLDILLAQVPERNITWISGEAQRLFQSIIGLCRSTRGTLNFHDALIALACRELGIPLVASFDQDWEKVSWLKRIGTTEQAKSLLEKP